jgi:hypothetical protein
MRPRVCAISGSGALHNENEVAGETACPTRDNRGVYGLGRAGGYACRVYQTMPNSAVYDRGLTKCVPLKVERKLYRATTFVMFTAVNCAR